MNSDLEEDFRNHQKMLLALLNERKDLIDGSRKALEVDRQIDNVESVVRSYQTVKWYEQERRSRCTRSFPSRPSRQAGLSGNRI